MRHFVSLGLTASAVLLFGFTGCSSDGGGGASGDCAQYVDSLSAYFDRCFGNGSAFVSDRARTVRECTALVAAPGASRLGANLSACSAKFSQAATCASEELSRDSACAALKGDLAIGAARAEGVQCASGFCKAASPDDYCGKCAPQQPLGAACSTGSSDECVADSDCVQTSNDAGICRPIKRVGTGESCESTADAILICSAGLTCFFATNSNSMVTAPPVCRAPAAAGGDCGSKLDCASGLACIERKCRTPTVEGAACTSYDECAKGLQCVTTCKKVTHVNVGEECDLARQCTRGQCLGGGTTGNGTSPGKCVDPLADGAACSLTTTDGTGFCDTSAKCIAGVCTFEDPSICK